MKMEVHTKIFTGALIMAALGGTPPLQAAEQPKRGANIEDLPIDASGTPTPQATKPPIAPPAENGEMIMVPRALWEKLLRDVEELKAKTGTPSTPSTTVPPLETEPSKSGTQTSSSGSRNYLLLPDISLVLQ